MEIEETGFTGLLIIKPSVYADSRGYFFESFNMERFREAGISFTPLQDNESRSIRGVIRGLHYQLKPYDQAKLIRVVTGKIYDVSVDLRKGSNTYGKWYGIELDSERKIQLFIPKGFAHGFSVLEDNTVIQYKVDNVYNRMSERGIALNDPELDIDWKLGDTIPVISDKDRVNPVFREAENNF
ncbi:MAG TPA: dTDP-4-dehydrorhamnose 3,5-epimerase [Bacteroidales bacterium]|nr:dTDP-4-dehydrorhamnose 3,5-epimerase [Bacteroidales bacterium]HPI69394.1 dTDP-4-dehydrorhamnose 3,5-epimerase [Bacteroidales bacterium]HPR72835.1 dTDP-4-dehydrorhamnose 3,5-epimerase [Bacteroidales bacterium]